MNGADSSRRMPSGATPLAERIAALQRKTSSPTTSSTAASTPSSSSTGNGASHLSPPPSSARSFSSGSSAAAVKERIARFQSRAGNDEKPLVPRSSFGAPGPNPSTSGAGPNVLRSFPAAQATGSGSGNWGEGVLRPQMTGGAWLGVGPSPSSLESGGHAIRPQMTGGVWGRTPSGDRESRRGASDSGYGSPSRTLGGGKDAFAELDADPAFARGGQGRISPAPSLGGRGPSPSPSSKNGPHMMRRGSSFSKAQIEAASSGIMGRSNSRGGQSNKDGSSPGLAPATAGQSPPPPLRLTSETSSPAAAAAAAALAARSRHAPGEADRDSDPRSAAPPPLDLPSVPSGNPGRSSADKAVMASPRHMSELPNSAGADEERKETQLGDGSNANSQPIVIEVSGVSGVTSRPSSKRDSLAVISSLPSVPRTPPRNSSLPLHPEPHPSAGDVVEIQIAGASPEQVAALRAKLALEKEVEEPIARPSAALGVYEDDDGDDGDDGDPAAGIGRLALHDAGDASASESGCSSIASPTKSRGSRTALEASQRSVQSPASPTSSSAAFRSVPADWATSSGWKAPRPPSAGDQTASDGTLTASNSAATVSAATVGASTRASPAEAAARAREAINMARSKSSTSATSAKSSAAGATANAQRLRRPPPGKMLSAAELDASDDDYEPGWASVISSSRS